MGSPLDTRVRARLSEAAPPPTPQPATAPAFVVNLSDHRLLLTALLPEDSHSERQLMLTILDDPDPAQASQPRGQQRLNRECSIGPGEMLQFSLRTLPSRDHVSLFRLRKEGEVGSAFLKYTVSLEGALGSGAIAQVGPRLAGARIQQPHPHLLWIG